MSSGRVRAPNSPLALPGDARTSEQQTAAARKLLERLDRVIARLTGMIPPLVRASRAAAAAECSRIGHAGDAALWADARRQWEACENRYHAAYARFREAEALLAAGGNRADVKTLMREAHAVADDLGARPLLEQLQALARRARIDLDDRRPPEAGAESPPWRDSSSRPASSRSSRCSPAA